MRVTVMMMLFVLQNNIEAMKRKLVRVNDSVELNSFIYVKPYRMSLHQDIDFTLDHNIFSGFLVTISNRMDIHHDSCSLLDNLLILTANNRTIRFGCSHYIVQYFPSPLTLNFMSSVFASLSDHITIRITAMRFSCPLFHSIFRRCPNQPLFCIQRHLFCDGNDNCGLNADEMECSKTHEHISISIVDKRSMLEQYILNTLVVFSMIISLLLLLFIYRWHTARRIKYRSHVVKNAFGDSIKKRNSTDPEETVALLTLGLRSFLPHVAAPKTQYRSMSYTNGHVSFLVNYCQKKMLRLVPY